MEERNIGLTQPSWEAILLAGSYLKGKHNWIPVEERLPKINDVASSWDCSDDVYIYLATHSYCVGRYEHDKSTNEFYWVLYGVDKDIPVTHWMPLPQAPRKEE